jgi:hypothetical protein
MASNSRIVAKDKLERCERKQPWPVLRYNPGIYLEGTRKRRKNYN